jgi:hypothetical protein
MSEGPAVRDPVIASIEPGRRSQARRFDEFIREFVLVCSFI